MVESLDSATVSGWQKDQSFLHTLADDPVRNAWLERECSRLLPQLLPRLPAEVRVKDRLGPLGIDNIVHETELQCWMVPADGSSTRGKILGPNHRVKLFSPEGAQLFDGLWGEVPRQIIESNPQLIIWLPAPQRNH